MNTTSSQTGTNNRIKRQTQFLTFAVKKNNLLILVNNHSLKFGNLLWAPAPNVKVTWMPSEQGIGRPINPAVVIIIDYFRGSLWRPCKDCNKYYPPRIICYVKVDLWLDLLALDFAQFHLVPEPIWPGYRPGTTLTDGYDNSSGMFSC